MNSVNFCSLINTSPLKCMDTTGVLISRDGLKIDLESLHLTPVPVLFVDTFNHIWSLTVKLLASSRPIALTAAYIFPTDQLLSQS
jgi:hypothetical protein